ncbi:FtsW/RodA/SpoVE family cell cycle protein [Priestia flexa]|uniref:Probable peptidoglycan glycosyltransferase FtsW n=1 Tax=Priestia flexa TaxID=86664 RepID=A0A8I1MG49_9BACI|nr:FtsW/RodA/SpoVE family cell cycle protein [Priestia flexa]MBN8252447.1 FtsW/RodA/SpoVE family cell cycle protein [Priestia flexa]MBN8433917.1 FtsW/RodA/SpoVE family cell cycle protein [Priestia flexa]MCA0966447.1 FtsW/RodA/SpoVE family cell cycle protein [Priestia flexa]
MLKKIFKHYDYSIIITIALLCTIGLVMVYSSSMITSITRYGQDSDFFYGKQKGWLIIAGFVFLATILFPYKLYQKLLPIAVLGTFGLLGLVFLMGHTAGGAQSWLKLAGASLQPAEFAKLTVILYLALVLGKRQEYINDIKRAFIGPIGLTMGIFIFVAIQPDLGTGMIILIIAVAIMLCSGISRKTFFKLILLGIVMLTIMGTIGVLTGQVTENRIGRFTGASDPFKYAQGEGYQLVNSYLAIGSGGLKGLGLGESVQKYGYLPESHTDFIMAVIAEELGFFGVFLVLGLLGFLIYRILTLAKRSKDPFASLICIGVATMLGIQAFINLGGLTGLIPITGVTLPFISYGGSSLLSLMIAMGIVVNISFFVNYQEKSSKKANNVVSYPNNANPDLS